MRIRNVAFAALFAAAGCGADNLPDCKLATLNLHVALRYAGLGADTVTVQSKAPPFTRTFTRSPTANDLGNPTYVIDFPGGYPADKLLLLTVTASAKGQPLAEGLAQIHLLPGCTEAAVTLWRMPAEVPDAGPPTD